MQVASKAAGVYFIVTDASQVAPIESENKMRLIFINVDKGPVNVLLKFAKGDTAGFYSIFGKGTRLMEKRGNFSISTCVDALQGGPLAVINLRAFEDSDISTVLGLNPNINDESLDSCPYTALFNIDSFWSPKPKNIPSLLTSDAFLTFGSVGIFDTSVIVTKARSITNLTGEGDATISGTVLEIDEYPVIDPNMIVKDTFVDVYVFANTFNPATVSTNQYYGQYFDEDGNVSLDDLDALTEVAEAGFIKKYTGSIIPNLKSETDSDLSIDVIMNSDYIKSGMICFINDDLFESVDTTLIDMNGKTYFDGAGARIVATSDYMLSHVTPTALTTATTVYPLTAKAENVSPSPSINLVSYKCVKVNETQFEGSFEQGIRVGDKFRGVNDTIVEVTGIEVLDEAAIIGVSTDTYTKVKITCSGQLLYTSTNTTVTRVVYWVDSCSVKPFNITSYKPRIAQFTNGSASRQNDILDMMNNPGIIKGIKNTKGLRYIVDAFKSFVEPGYKHQYGTLVNTLDISNRFLRVIYNEPFYEDMVDSTNPMFKQMPGARYTFDWSYLPEGGNKTYSSKLLTKFITGSSMAFSFGPGNVINTSTTRPVAGLVSNLFYGKKYAYDIIANETGYIDGIVALETLISDDEREYTEKFRYNAIIELDGAYTIFSNLTSQKATSKQSQIQNSELLAYIKENLYTLGKKDSFKTDNYDDYLRLETQSKNFIQALTLAGAIKANFVVQCDANNNTKEIANAKMKVVHIEYTPSNSLEKIIFDLKID